MEGTIGFIERWQQRRKVRRYAKKLGPVLTKRYGVKMTYSRPQIRSAAQTARLPAGDICYGYAMFMDESDFDAVHRELGESCDYGAMRQDIADVCFSGDADFSSSDVMDYAAESSGFSGGDSDSDSASDSGSCSSGCGGGD